MYPHEKSTSTSRSRSFWAALLLSFAGLALVNHIQAQPGPTSASSEKEVGTIRGVVSQSETGQYLEGVVVRLVERNFTVLTDREGNFEFRNLPEGNYTVSANYTGLDTQTVAVAVARNETAVKRVELSSADTYTLEKITVAGTREGNAAAITRQRNAANVVNVVSMDAYGNVADGNIGNFMQKLPGISTVVENGDIVGVNIRGTPSELNSLSVDGTRAASAYAGFNPQGDRAAPVDQIPADSVKEIEVIKALTPDLPADSLGGIVNVVTKSALDYNRPLFTYRLGANHNTYREGNDRWTPTGSISYISKFGKKERVGLAVSTSYSETTNTRERMTTSRIEADARPTSGSALDDVVTRIRAGAALKVDLQASDSTRLWLSLNHNYFSFHSVRFNQNFAAGGSRRIADYNVVSRAQIEAGATPRTTTNQTAGLAPGFSDDLSELLAPTYLNRTAAGTRQSRQYKAEIGATSELSNEQKIAFRLSYNPTRYQNLFQGFDLRLNGPAVGVAIDSRDGRSPPMYYQTYGPSVGLGSDMGMYRAERFETPERSEEEVTNFRLDYEKGAKLGDHRSVFKAGINWRQQHRISQEVDGRVWNYVGADGVVGRNSVTGLNDDNLGQFLKSETGYTLFNNHSRPIAEGAGVQVPAAEEGKAWERRN
jgi:TonB-dependent receptor